MKILMTLNDITVKDDCIAAISSWPTLARAANLVTSLRTNLSQARAAFISAMTHSENQVLLNICKLSSFQFSFNITPIRYGFLKYVHWIYQNESSCVQLFPHHLGLSNQVITSLSGGNPDFLLPHFHHHLLLLLCESSNQFLFLTLRHREAISYRFPLFP